MHFFVDITLFYHKARYKNIKFRNLVFNINNYKYMNMADSSTFTNLQ